MQLTAFSKSRPLLLLSEFPADTKGGAAVIIRGLLREADPAAINWLTLSAPKSLDTSLWPEQTCLKGGSAGHDPNRPSAFKDSTIYCQALADEVLQIASERNAAAIWVILHNAGVPIAARLVRQRRVPVHVTVNDDPPLATTMRSRRTLVLLPWMVRDFKRALRGAASVDSTSEPMAERYRLRVGVDSIVVHRGLLEADINPSPPFDAAIQGLTVAMLGNPYNYGQLPLLAKAMATAAQQQGINAKLIMVGGQAAGRRLKRRCGSWLDIELYSHLEEPEAVSLLSKCALLYLNYPFTLSTRVLRQTSFPVKLSTYAMSSRPILMHAPRDSSTAEIGKMTPYVVHWDSDRVADGVQLLTKAWKNPSLARSFHREAEALRKRYFDYPVLRDRLFDALNALPSKGASSADGHPRLPTN